MGNNIIIKPTESMYYREFDTCIKLIKIPRNFHFTYTRINNSGKLRYRVVKNYRSRHEYDANFYTSDESIIESLLQGKYEVVEITKPLNKTHKELLHKRDRKVVIREKLWFNRYKHKISAWHNYDRATTPIESKEMVEWIHEHFPRGENRIVSTSYGFYFSAKHLSQPPTIFTNSEETMMLMKLAYSNMLRMTMETCITLQEIDN